MAAPTDGLAPDKAKSVRVYVTGSRRALKKYSEKSHEDTVSTKRIAQHGFPFIAFIKVQPSNTSCQGVESNKD